MSSTAEKLDQARAELRDAERIVHMLGIAAADPETPPAFARRLDVEVAVAARRLELWRAVVAKLEGLCGHVGPRGTICQEAAEHGGSHGDGSVLRWITR